MHLYEPPFETDGCGTVTIGEWGGWLVQVVPMLFNDRLVLTPKHAPMVYDYGWCYDKGVAPYVAAVAWDPETEGEPPGYKKAAAGGRQPGEKAGENNHGLDYLALVEMLVGPLETDVLEGDSDQTRSGPA